MKTRVRFFRILASATALAAATRTEAAVGGPDGFGYTWCDSDEPGVDASVPGYAAQDFRTTFGFTGDETVVQVVLPAAIFRAGFPYYGVQYSSFWLSSNGWLSFVDPAGNAQPSPQSIPSPPSPNATAAFFWDDWTLEGAAPLAEGGPDVAGDGYTFRVHVSPKTSLAQVAELYVTLFQSGVIKMVYRRDILAVKSAQVAGIENAPATIGLPYMLFGAPSNGAKFRSDYAVEYHPPGFACPAPVCATTADAGPPGSVCQGLVATLDARGSSFSCKLGRPAYRWEDAIGNLLPGCDWSDIAVCPLATLSLPPGASGFRVRVHCSGDLPSCETSATTELDVVADQAPPGAGNVLRAVRTGTDAVFSWTPFSPTLVSVYRLYEDGQKPVPAATRVNAVEVAYPGLSGTDPGTLARAPFPVGYYQLVGVSCLGDLEGPY